MAWLEVLDAVALVVELHEEGCQMWHAPEPKKAVSSLAQLGNGSRRSASLLMYRKVEVGCFIEPS